MLCRAFLSFCRSSLCVGGKGAGGLSSTRGRGAVGLGDNELAWEKPSHLPNCFFALEKPALSNFWSSYETVKFFQRHTVGRSSFGGWSGEVGRSAWIDQFSAGGLKNKIGVKR